MHEDALKNTLQTAVDRRLSGLEGNPFLAQRIICAEKGDQKVKKFSVSLALALALMIITLSVGFALVSSGIIDHLYGGEEAAPQAIVEQIVKPQETAGTALGKITVDELLYDGTALHTTLTVHNPTNETLLYTIDGLRLDGEYIMGSNILCEGAGYGGVVLGGTIDGVQLPDSYTLYSKGEYLIRYNANGKFQDHAVFSEGEQTLTVTLAVWRPLNTPQLIDYRDYEGVNTAETRRNLVTDAAGLCELELFRPEVYRRNTTAKDVSSDVYADVYKELGWAEKIDSVTLEIPVTLDKTAIPHAMPTQMTYTMGDLTLVFDQFDFTQAGGQARGTVSGDYNSVRNFLRSGVQLVDKATDRVFTGGLLWNDDGKDGEGVAFTLRFLPFTGDMPQTVQLAPVIEYNDRWVPTSPAYDPSIQKPDNAVDCWVLDFDRAVTMELTQN